MAIESPADSDVKMDMGALWGALRRRWLRIVLVTALLLAGTYALLLFVPKQYESTAGILVESRDSVYTRPASDPTNSSASAESPDSIISSQIELVKSRDTLLPVVRSLKLAQLPEFNGTAKSSLGFLTSFLKKPTTTSAEDIAVDTLSDHLTVIRERDSALINVIVRSGDPALAAKLANAIAQEDVARRAGLSLSDTADASQWLQQQITVMRQRVQDAEDKVANFKVSNDLYTGGNNTSLLDQQMTEISTQITAAQERMNTAQSRANLIRGLLAAGQPIDGVDDVRNSVTIQQLMAQKAQLTSQKAQLLATLLPSHPTVKAVTAQIDSTDRQIAIEGRRVADALEAEGKIEASLQTTLEGNLADIKSKAAGATRQTVSLDALDREAKADRDLLEGYMSRYRDAASRTDANSALPDLRVVTLASASPSPASPKTTLILGAVTFVSIAAQIGAILFGELLSGRALVDSRRSFSEMEVDEAAEEIVTSRRESAAIQPAARDEAIEAGNAVTPQVLPPEAAPIETAEVSEAAAPAARGLRTWFTKRARTVGATLTAYEPPVITPSSAAVPEAVEAAPVIEPPVQAVIAEEPAAPAPEVPAAPSDNNYAERLANLSADLILGRTRILMLASLDDDSEGEVLAERLVADVLHRGLSVARVDAGSGRPSREPGITDLSHGQASFGDVVHGTADPSLAEVLWGHLATPDPQSGKPFTLVEALADIYEVVLVLTGAGENSSLPLFAGLPARLVLASRGQPDAALVAAARANAAALGYADAEIIVTPARRAQVA